eukprot:19849-Heterococcus_DN1.PRE.1
MTGLLTPVIACTSQHTVLTSFDSSDDHKLVVRMRSCGTQWAYTLTSCSSSNSSSNQSKQFQMQEHVLVS